MKTIVLSVICGAIPSVILMLYPSLFGISLDVKSIYMGLITSICNFYLILWAWSRIFLKKRIALATGVIVIKYAILGIIIYKIVSIETYEIASFLVGMVSIVFMIICYAVIQRVNNNQG